MFKRLSVLTLVLVLLMTTAAIPLAHAADNTASTSNTGTTSNTTNSSTSSSGNPASPTVQSNTYGNGSTGSGTSTNSGTAPNSGTSTTSDPNAAGGTSTTTPASTVVTTTPTTTQTVDPALLAQSAVAPAASTSTAQKSILTDAYLTDANGNVIKGDGTGAAIDPNAPLNLNYKWALPDDGSYKAGSTFEFDLPSNFTLYNDINNVSLDFGNLSVGSFNATQSGHVTVTFNSTIEHYSDIHGTMQFRTSLSQQTVSGSTEVKIPVPLGDSSQFIVIYLKPNQAAALSKYGRLMSTSQINWTVDVNATNEMLTNAVLSDPMMTGLKLDPSSVKVYALTVNVDGSKTAGSQLSSGYTLTADDSQFKLSFDSSTRSAYRVTYATTITDNTQSIFKNTASLSSNSGTVTADAQVTVRKQILSKKVESYDATTGTINWSIGYNLNKQQISQTQAVLQDRFDSTQQLVNGSIKVYDSNNNVLTEGTDYTVTAVAPQNGITGFNLQFAKDVQSSYTIKYSTTPVGQIIQNGTVTNKVTANGTSATASQTLKGLTFKKDLTDANYIDKTASWKLTFNSQKQALQNTIIEDQFPNGGLELLPTSLKVSRADGSDYPSGNYTVSVTDVRAGFKITFNQPPTEPLTITYRTTFNEDWKKAKSDLSYQNVAALYWTENGKTMTIPSEARFWPDDLTVHNGAKEGSYNAVTKEITWVIKMNYNNKTLTNAVLSDAIQAGQTYVPGSLGVYNMTLLGWWNGVQQGAVVNPSAYTATTPAVGTNGGTVQVSFANPINSAYWITFKTTLNGQVIPKSVSNTATLKANEGNYSWSANVNIPNGGEYVSKSGVQNGGNIDWTININAGQSYVENAKILDTPTPNQILLTNSFHLYAATVAADGSLTRGAEAVQGTDYKLSVIPGTPEKFELSFNNPIQSPYVLKYSTLITAADRATVSNSVQFTGNGVTTGTVKTSKDIIVRISSASGTGSGAVGNLLLNKVDSADASVTLAGAVFKLQDSAGLRKPVQLTTDAQGRALFTNLLYGTYSLKEITAPSGYALDPTVRTVKIDAASQQSGALTITLTNTKAVGSLLVHKVDSADATVSLAGAVFKLQDSAGLRPSVTVATYAQGDALFTNLPYGTYNLQEVTAPTGYVLDPTVHSVTIDATNQQSGPFKITLTNAKAVGSLLVHKVDSADATVSLAGAVFKLQDSAGLRPSVTVATYAQGDALFTNLPYGTYNLQEVTAPTGYVLDPTVHSVTINATNQQSGPLKITLTNAKAVASLRVHKVDSLDGNVSLAGAVFKLQDSAGLQVPVTLTTNAQGEALFTNLPYGTYNLQEMTAPTGYVLDSTVHSITINATTLKGSTGLQLTLTNTKTSVIVPPPTSTPTVTPDRKRPNPTTPSGNASPGATDPTITIPDNPVPQGTVTPQQSSVPPADETKTPDVTIPDDPVPQGTTTPDKTPDVTIPDDPIPQGTTTPDKTPDITIPDDPIPQGTTPATPVHTPSVSMLPKTGEDSNAPYWLAGTSLLALGILLNRLNSKKARTGDKSK